MPVTVEGVLKKHNKDKLKDKDSKSLSFTGNGSTKSKVFFGLGALTLLGFGIWYFKNKITNSNSQPSNNYGVSASYI